MIPKGYMKSGLLELAIIDILFHDNSEIGMESLSITKKLKEEGIERTYDTISKHLKEMADNGIILRKAMHTRYGALWEYYYKL